MNMNPAEELYERAALACPRCRPGSPCPRHRAAIEVARNPDVTRVAKARLPDGDAILVEVAVDDFHSLHLVLTATAAIVAGKPVFTFYKGDADGAYSAILEALSTTEDFARTLAKSELSKAAPRVYVLHGTLRDALRNPDRLEAEQADGATYLRAPSGRIKLYAAGADVYAEAEQDDAATIVARDFPRSPGPGELRIKTGEKFDLLLDKPLLRAATPRQAIEKLLAQLAADLLRRKA